MSEIQAGDGYRLLGPDEVVKDGDEVLFPFTGWGQAKDIGNRSGRFIYRRRIPAKPDVLKIQSEGGLKGWMRKDNTLVLEQKDDSGGFECVLIWETKSIRQVIAWLQQVADWREAQDSK